MEKESVVRLRITTGGESITTQGESFYFDLCNELEKELIEKKIAKYDNGALICFFDNLSPLVLKKSNGNFLVDTILYYI